MYAILFELECNDHQEYTHVYNDIKQILESHGFVRQQSGLFFGSSTVDAVRCVLAVTTISVKYPEFPAFIKYIRMLRIDENSDLMPAVQMA
jgi:virulence-associated protein VapD